MLSNFSFIESLVVSLSHRTQIDSHLKYSMQLGGPYAVASVVRLQLRHVLPSPEIFVDGSQIDKILTEKGALKLNDICISY